MPHNNPKHIVIDARSRPSSTGRYVDRLIEHLQEIDDDNRYTILVRPSDTWQPKASNFQRVDTDYEQFSLNPLDQLRFARQLRSLKPDLVHFAMTQQPLLYTGTIVTTTHDLTMLTYTRASRFPSWIHAINTLLYKFLFWWSHKKSSTIIVPSQYVADALGSYQPFTRSKTVVTHEASEPPLPVKSQPLNGVTKPFIFHVGSPFPHKNIDHLIRAFDKLKITHPDLQLVLPGKIVGVFAEQLETWRQASSYRSDIIVPGFISDPQLKWLYENATCYVLPSLSEGFGLPGLEAMAHGCPLASSNATCLPEIYGDAAEYFDPTSVDDMTRAVTTLLDSADRRTALKTAGYRQIDNYSWEKMAKETLLIYNKHIA